MGLTTWKNAPDGRILKSDVTVAKNYLSEKQIRQLERMEIDMNRIEKAIDKLCPHGVEYAKLNRVCQIYDGTHSTPNYTDYGVKYVSVENINDLYSANKYISEEDYRRFKIKPQKGDVFMTRINDADDVMAEWHEYIVQERGRELDQIIKEERLREPETRRFLENAFRDGEIRTTGTDLDKILPPFSRFGGSGREKKKQSVIDKLKAFFDRYYGLTGVQFMDKPESFSYCDSSSQILMAAEERPSYGSEKR